MKTLLPVRLFRTITAIADETVSAPSVVPLGHGNRAIITLFNTFVAHHPRHFTLEGHPAAINSRGRHSGLSRP